MAAQNEILIRIQAELGDLLAELGKVKGLLKQSSDASRDAFSKISTDFDGLTVAAGKLTLAYEAVQRVATSLRALVAPSIDFQEAMLRVNTISRLSAEDLAELSRRVEDLALRLPQTATQLADGLYQTLSSGVSDTGEALNVLETSARAAVGGMTDAFTAVDVITTILNSYGMETTEAGRVSDLLFKTVEDGKTTFEELAPVLGRVTPIASNLGVSFEELSAAVATLTIGGIRTEQAVTGVLSLLRSLSTVSEEGKVYAESLGLTWDTTIVKTHGLLGTIQALREATNGNAEAIKALVNDSEGWVAALALTGEGYGKLVEEVRKMSGAAGAADEAFLGMTEAASNQVRLMGNALAQISRDISDRALPMFTQLANGLRSLAENFDDLEAAARPALALMAGWAVATAVAAIPAVLAGIGASVTALQTALWGLAAAEAAATGGLSAIAAAAGVATIGALSYKWLADSLGAVAEISNAAAPEVGKLNKEIEGLGVLPVEDLGKSFQQILDELKEKNKAEEDAAKERARIAKQAAEERAKIIAEYDLAERLQALRQIVEGNKAYRDGLKAREALVKDLRARAFKRQRQATEESFQRDQDRFRRQAENFRVFIQAFATGLSDSLAGAWERGASGLREGLKAMLNTILAAIEQLVVSAKIASLANALVRAKFNPALSVAALAQDLPAIIGLEALFAVLRVGINKFEHGGVIDRPTLALMGEAVHRSGREIVAPERSFKEWATDTLLPLVGGAGSGELLNEMRGLRADLAPARFGKSAGRAIGRELALAGRGVL